MERNLTGDPKLFLRTIDPYREDLVVAVECIFTWYWLAGLCEAAVLLQRLRDCI